MPIIHLPTVDRRVEPYRLGPPSGFAACSDVHFSRIAFAAAHVVADPMAAADPWLKPAIDWDGTIAYRRHLWGLGFGVAEAMDTAQRGTGLGWADALDLIRLSIEAARDFPGALIYCGAGTDHLPAAANISLDDVIGAYETRDRGDREVRWADRPDGQSGACRHRAGLRHYARVYNRILGGVRNPSFCTGLATCSTRSGRLLGACRCRRRHAGRAIRHRGQQCQGRRHQDLAARQGSRDRHAPDASAGRPHVYG